MTALARISALDLREEKTAVSAPVNTPTWANPTMQGYGLFVNPGEITPRQAWLLYENVSTLAKVVDLIADNVAKLEPLVEIDGEVVKDGDPAWSELLDLLERPGFNRDRRMLIKELAVQRLVTGTAYLAALGNTNYLPVVLDVFKSWVVTPVQAAGLWPERYTYTEGTATAQFEMVPGRDFRWLGEMAELFPIYDIDGNRRGIGLSRLSAIKSDVELRLRGTEHHISVMDNGARPSGLVSFKDQLTPDQFESVKEQLNSDMSGGRNAGKIAVTSGGEMDFKPLSMTSKDMDWANLVKMVEDSIVARFNVPVTLYNVSAQTNNNYATALTAFYDNAVLPEFQVVWGPIARLLSIRTGRTVKIKHNTITNNVLLKQAIEQANALHNNDLISTNEARLIIGYEAVIGGDVMYGSTGKIPVGEDFFTDHMDAMDHANPGASTVLLPGQPTVEQPEDKPGAVSKKFRLLS